MSAPRRSTTQPQPIDRIFVSIAAHRDSLAPDMRVRTIYPRYLEQDSTPVEDGLTHARLPRRLALCQRRSVLCRQRPRFTARCTRDAATPGMCLSERRIDGADLTFRFPRSWLSQWRDVASRDGAADGATARAEGVKSVRSAKRA